MDVVVVGYRVKDGENEQALDEVVLVDLARGQKVRYAAAEGRDPADPARAKPTVAAACRSFLCYKRDFPPFPSSRSPVAVVGFGAEDFLLTLAYECARPDRGSPPLPYALAEPDGPTRVDLRAPSPRAGAGEFLAAFRPADPAEAAAYDAMVAGWEGPGRDPEQDCRLATYLAVRYGYAAPRFT